MVHSLLQESDSTYHKSTDVDDYAEEVEVSSKSPKRYKSDETNMQVFDLPNDKLSKKLPDPFIFPEQYSPEISVCISNQSMPPKTVDKFITAIAVFLFKCYPTTPELEQVARQTTEKYPFLRAPAGSPYVS